MTKKSFQNKIYKHFAENGRKLPWRITTDPYKILVSEIMLQQTQVARVIPKYTAFVKAFPTARKLAQAPIADVLKLWQGLGYNRRALLLKKTAEFITKEYAGEFPDTYDELLDLPGVGPYTASAIMSFAYNKPTCMIETNIRAAYLHTFFKDKKGISDKELMPLIEKYQDTSNPRQWYNALMDYGAYLKETLPNPSRKSSHHIIQSRFEGSMRQVRGAIIRLYTENPKSTKRTILSELPYTREVKEAQYNKLKEEGFFK